MISIIIMLLYTEDPLPKNTVLHFLYQRKTCILIYLLSIEIYHDFLSYIWLDLPIPLHFPVHKHVKT